MADRAQYFAKGDEWPEEMLGSWRWLIGGPRYSVCRVTAMGSLFLCGPDGGVFFLDTTEGQFRRVADSVTQLDVLFESTENRRTLLWSFLVRDLRKTGPTLAHGQCYGWKVPPVLGGDPGFENIEPSDVAPYVSLLGQVHEQARAIPPGQRVDEIRIVPSKPSLWRRLFRSDRPG